MGAVLAMRSEVNRLLQNVESGLVPLDLRHMNGMKKVEDSKPKKSVEGFLTFMYWFVALWTIVMKLKICHGCYRPLQLC